MFVSFPDSALAVSHVLRQKIVSIAIVRTLIVFLAPILIIESIRHCVCLGVSEKRLYNFQHAARSGKTSRAIESIVSGEFREAWRTRRGAFGLATRPAEGRAFRCI